MIVSGKKDKNLYIIIFTTNKVGIKLCCRAEKKAGVKIAAYISDYFTENEPSIFI